MGDDAGVPSLDTFLDDARTFLAGIVRPRSATTREPTEPTSRMALFSGSSLDEVRSAVEYQRSLYDGDYGWISGPRALGGAGLPDRFERAFAAVEREFAIPSKAPLSVSLGMVAPTLAQFGSEEAKATWLAGLRRADVVGCQLFSEPDAGSDLAAVTTRAVRDGDDWILTGQKVWTSGAHYSDIGIALTRTSPGPRHHNLTAFVVDMRSPGVDVRPLRQITGEADFNEVFLTDVRVPDAHRLGEVDAGWACRNGHADARARCHRGLQQWG